MSSHADFDFFIGEWTVHNERLRSPLSGTESWYEFGGTSSVRPIWGRTANVDEYVGNSPDGVIHGLTVRLFDPAAEQWRLYWASSRDGQFGIPLVGAFVDGRGEFFDHEIFEKRSIFVRFLWMPRIAHRLSLGTSVFRRRRRDVGNELDHEVLATVTRR